MSNCDIHVISRSSTKRFAFQSGKPPSQIISRSNLEIEDPGSSHRPRSTSSWSPCLTPSWWHDTACWHQHVSHVSPWKKILYKWMPNIACRPLTYGAKPSNRLATKFVALEGILAEAIDPIRLSTAACSCYHIPQPCNSHFSLVLPQNPANKR